MVMRRKSQAEEIEELKVILINRKSRVEWLISQINGASKSDLKWITKEIAEHRKFISDTEKLIKKFYAPAIKEVSA